MTRCVTPQSSGTLIARATLARPQPFHRRRRPPVPIGAIQDDALVRFRYSIRLFALS